MFKIQLNKDELLNAIITNTEKEINELNVKYLAIIINTKAHTATISNPKGIDIKSHFITIHPQDLLEWNDFPGGWLSIEQIVKQKEKEKQFAIGRWKEIAGKHLRSVIYFYENQEYIDIEYVLLLS